MAEYIEREAAKRALADSDVVPKYKADNRPVTDKIIDDIPAADVAPVVWTHLGGDEWCCLCGAFETGLHLRTAYCPGCGAKMDKEEDNDQT